MRVRSAGAAPRASGHPLGGVGASRSGLSLSLALLARACGSPDEAPIAAAPAPGIELPREHRLAVGHGFSCVLVDQHVVC